MTTITSGTAGITFPDGTTQASAANVGAGGVIYVNGQTITANYTYTANTSGVSVGPISLNNATVTLATGSRWVIL